MMINSLMSNMALEAEVVFLTQLNSTFFSQLQKQPIPTVNFVEQNQNHFLLNFVKAPQLEVEGNLVKSLNHCRLENMKKLVEPSFFGNCPTKEIFFSSHIIRLFIRPMVNIEICVILI